MNWLDAWEATARRRLPSRAVAFAPAQAFFVRSYPVAGKLTEAELASLAALSLEADAPFPIEALSWGWVGAPEAPRVLVYAAYRERLLPLLADGDESRPHLFPGFLGRLGATYPVATVTFVRAAHSLSAVCLEAGQWVPTRVLARALPDEAPPAAALAVRQQLVAALGANAGYAPEEGFWELAEHEAGLEGAPLRPRWRQLLADPAATGEGAAQPQAGIMPWPLRAPALWQADVRPAETKAATARSRLWSARVDQWTAIGLVSLLILLGAVVLQGAVSLWVGSLRQTITAQTEAVAALRDRQELVFRLEQFGGDALQPVPMIERVNQVRPKSLHFTSIEVEPGSLLISGEAKAVVDLNNFLTALKTVPGVVQAVQEDLRATAREVRYGIRVTFAPDAFRPTEAPLRPAPAAEDGAEPSEGETVAFSRAELAKRGEVAP